MRQRVCRKEEYAMGCVVSEMGVSIELDGRVHALAQNLTVVHSDSDDELELASAKDVSCQARKRLR